MTRISVFGDVLRTPVSGHTQIVHHDYAHCFSGF